MSDALRLHLGCGERRWDGWVNVDMPGSGAEVECDLMDTLPWADGVADEIEAIHVWEHFPLPVVRGVMTEWVRVLKPGGRLTLEMPCRDKVFDMIRAGVTDERLVVWPLYGDPRTFESIADIHKWCWSKDELATLMHRCGLREIASETPKFHVAQRDMRMIGVKRAD
jgi:predicted SAM-dependent methyltransferase